MERCHKQSTPPTPFQVERGTPLLQLIPKISATQQTVTCLFCLHLLWCIAVARAPLSLVSTCLHYINDVYTGFSCNVHIYRTHARVSRGCTRVTSVL